MYRCANNSMCQFESEKLKVKSEKLKVKSEKYFSFFTLRFSFKNIGKLAY
jgi:hypothetical protein